MGLQGVNKVMKTALANMSNDAFQQVGSVLNNNKNHMREVIQKETSTEIKNIIDHLENKRAISTEELELIKLWIVGDAESYVKMENNFQDWLQEFKRLETVLKEYENKECSLNDLLKLRGILQDAIRISYDIANFLDNKERITKFEKAASDVSNIDVNALVRILTAKLQSPDL
jgi:uncharacterized protein YbgA (DUF1722 family)